MKVFDYHPIFKKTELDNGVRVITEHHPFTRSTAAGIYVDLGTRDEPKHLGGAAHFIEHLVFKGTGKLDAFDIAKSLEQVGGDLNAYTTREYTCFHGTTLKEHLSLSLEVLADLATDARFSKDDFEKERQVVLQEIDMSKDSLEEYVFDLYFEYAFARHPLGQSILGTPQSLAGMTRTDLLKFYRTRYKGENLIVSVAGDVDHNQVVDWVGTTLARVKGKPKTAVRTRPKLKVFRKFVSRPSEQVHVLVGVPSCSYRDANRFESYIVNAILGGGMTSRLYQKVREKKGLVYSIYSYLQSFTDSGLLLIYAGASDKNMPVVLRIIHEELHRLRKQGISQRELDLFRTQVKGQILLGADDVENRMNSLAVNEMIFGRYRTIEEVIQEIDDITVSSVQQYLRRFFNRDGVSVLLAGDLKPERAKRLLELG